MDIRPLPANEDAVRRYVEALWLPYHRDLQATIEDHALADDVDVVAEEVAFRLGLLESESFRAWVAVDDRSDSAGEFAGELAGFITTDIEESPSVFDSPDRLVVGDIYVREPYRGSGLAQELMARAAERAREAGCPQIRLDVDADNERAIAFYEKLGFETYRREMGIATDDL